jgi:hypothetical protein
MSVQDFTFHIYLPSQDARHTFATLPTFLAQHGLLLHNNTIRFPDGGLACAVQVHPVRDRAEISIIRLDCGGVYFDGLLPEETINEPTSMMPFLQAWQTYVQWCAYLCEHATPHFGVGFGLLEDRSGDIETICAAALQQGQLPNLDAGILAVPPFAQYADEPFAGDPLVQAWYQAGYIVQQLASRGIFGVSTQRQATMRELDAQLHLLHYARQLASTYRATRDPHTRAEIERVLRRAQAMQPANGDDIADAIRHSIS